MTTKHTPVTGMVREHEGDYLAAVEDLEASHEAMRKALKAAEQRILEVSVVNNVPGGQSQAVLHQIRAALALAVDVREFVERILSAWPSSPQGLAARALVETVTTGLYFTTCPFCGRWTERAACAWDDCPGVAAIQAARKAGLA